jgi:hypothetical protein
MVRTLGVTDAGVPEGIDDPLPGEDAVRRHQFLERLRQDGHALLLSNKIRRSGVVPPDLLVCCDEST